MKRSYRSNELLAKSVEDLLNMNEIKDSEMN